MEIVIDLSEIKKYKVSKVQKDSVYLNVYTKDGALLTFTCSDICELEDLKFSVEEMIKTLESKCR